MPSNYNHAFILGEDGTHYYAIGLNSEGQLGIEEGKYLYQKEHVLCSFSLQTVQQNVLEPKRL
jgi:alpha-tubulin suppressor-like RCC1 family protein